ncbi:MAG: histidine kinase [Treponema sp.]|nr:histidine kinase [Treponema sp.]
MPFEFVIYFRLMWLFVIIITLLMLFLCYLYFAKQRAQRQESQSIAFSHLMIEGMETERRRISRELHDIILPHVNGMPVSDQIRSICMDLMPPDFSRLSFKDLLADICNKFSKRTGIECAYFINNDISFTAVSAENKLHLYRIVQESFTNIEKHSKAQKALLVARRVSNEAKTEDQSSDNILICISDEGTGLLSEEEGLGMKSIRQRAAIICAKVDFISESSNGLMVRIEIPAVT